MTECPTACLLDLSEPVVEDQTSPEKDSHPSIPDDSELLFNGEEVLIPDLSDKSNSNNNNSLVPLFDPDNLPVVEDTWLDKETFDFDVVLSPSENKKPENYDEDEEIFFGPMGFTEKCVAAVVAAQTPVKPMSPLNPQQLAEMIKEAHGVACLFSNMNFKSGSSSDDGVSPQKRILNTKLFAKSPKHNRTFTRENDSENINPNPIENNHVRTGTFTKDMDVKSLKNSTKEPLKESNVNITKDVKPESKLRKISGIQKPGLKPAYSKLPKSRSASNLPKAMSSDNLLDITGESVRQRYKSGDSEASECSILSDTSEASVTKLPASRTGLNKLKAPLTTGKKLQAPMIKPSLTNLKKGTNSKLTVKNISRQKGPMKSNHTRTTSNSSLDSVSSQSSSISNSSFMSASSNIGQPIIMSRVASASKTNKGPLTKLGGLIKPALQKVTQSDTRRSLNGPMKAMAASKPSGFQNRSFQERKPKSDSAPVITPVKQDKAVKPKRLSSTMGSMGKSSSLGSTGSSGSVTESTPTSTRKRHSLLPTPSKSRPSSTSSVPPSPLSCRSSNSSINSSVTSWLGASISDTNDSPVFETDTIKKLPVKGLVRESPSVMKPRKKLVQNTPDIPVKKPYRWSPLVRKKMDPQDQALHCTKRATKN
ncbi:hypothetical protein LOTGIDRAFT_238727 [Lottia gigantea]|uniref:G2 and S phase-expressed protein 1 N-terminal domain-containing protein n=1 Tax=Lottia gigantea TaxID=225164 RepID=V4AR47_LOTGI|nr:hypothetical protein LOTGIDRAFT_238727 [Lottia gigantea]ESO99722.1 hypothetical protein LOTGIDRAFT_238727 [Lottia gigantea]